MKENCKILAKIFIIVAVLELFVFNFDALCSYANDGYLPAYSVGEGLKYAGEDRYLVTDADGATLEFAEVGAKTDYIRLDIRKYSLSGTPLPLTMDLYLTDEGHYSYYHQGAVTSYGEVKGLTYHRLHPYGEVESFRIKLQVSDGQYIDIEALDLAARVPFEIRPIRLLVLALLVSILCAFRPGSVLYQHPLDLGGKLQKRVLTFILFANFIFMLLLVTINPAFCEEPRWDHHHQYHRLAESLLEGRLWLDYTDTEGLSALSNPYDMQLRRSSGVAEHWDTAFFEGKYYVYFGIVPVLLFYLPCLVLTGEAFPTWIGIAVCMTAILLGAFYLVYQLIKRYFPKVGYGHYLLLSLILANGTGLLALSMRPDFYTLPIVLALSFSLWGVALWIKAARSWAKRGCVGLLTAGALCLALTAGCRPQFLMGSFLFFPILGGFFLKKRWGNREGKRFLAIAFPYAVVAVLLMLYNYARFSSPFDFGANYNITTNDMTHRGFYLGRMREGIFQYLFQLPVWTTSFPFLRETYLTSDYLGQTIRENFFGGLTISHFVVSASFAYASVRRRMEDKEIRLLWWVSVMGAITILLADVSMAGIVVRYMTDFSWLLFLGAFVVILQLLSEGKSHGTVTWFLLLGFIFMAVFDLSAGLQLTELRSFMPEKYYEIQSFFK